MFMRLVFGTRMLFKRTKQNSSSLVRVLTVRVPHKLHNKMILTFFSGPTWSILKHNKHVSGVQNDCPRISTHAVGLCAVAAEAVFCAELLQGALHSV